MSILIFLVGALLKLVSNIVFLIVVLVVCLILLVEAFVSFMSGNHD